MLDTDKDDSTGLRKSVAEIRPPTSLESIMQSYIDQLPMKQAMLIRIASILGSRFEPELLCDLAVRARVGHTSEELLQHIHGLLNSGWLRESASGDAWELRSNKKKAAAQTLAI